MQNERKIWYVQYPRIFQLFPVPIRSQSFHASNIYSKGSSKNRDKNRPFQMERESIWWEIHSKYSTENPVSFQLIRPIDHRIWLIFVFTRDLFFFVVTNKSLSITIYTYSNIFRINWAWKMLTRLLWKRHYRRLEKLNWIDWPLCMNKENHKCFSSKLLTAYDKPYAPHIPISNSCTVHTPMTFEVNRKENRISREFQASRKCE